MTEGRWGGCDGDHRNADSRAPCQRRCGPGMTVTVQAVTVILLRLQAREFHHLAPFFGLVGDELAEVLRRAFEQRPAHLNQPPSDLGIAQAVLDRLIQTGDDLSRGGLWSDHAVPIRNFIAR